MRKKQFRRRGLLLIIILLIVFFLKSKWQWAYEVVPEWQVPLETNIDKIAILNNKTSVTWNGDSLVFYNKKGKVIGEVDRTGEGQEAYFGHDKVMLYDLDLRKVAVFDSQGRELSSYNVEGEVFSVTEQNGNILIHTKSDQGEILYLGDSAGGLEILFETEHFILGYEVENPKKFAISELSNEASGYRTTLYWNDNGLKKEEFLNEVSMFLDFHGKDLLMVTEKMLYLVNSEEVKEVEIPIMSDIVEDKSGIYLLHSGILTKYDDDLKEEKQMVMTANVEDLQKMDSMLVASGKGELIGNLMGLREFHIRLDQKEEFWELKEDRLLSYGENKLSMYRFKKKFLGNDEEIMIPEFKKENK